ncbi:MAG: amidohydrolase family protein [Gammaproteobacteria bacterium]
MFRPRLTRVLKFTAVAAILLFAVALAVNRMGGTSGPINGPIRDTLSAGAQALIAAAFHGLGSAAVADYHVHMIELSEDINPDMFSWRHPFERIKTSVMMSATGVSDLSRSDEQYLGRLLELTEYFGRSGRFFLYAFDRHYRRDGTVDPEKTVFHASNDYVVGIANRYPDRFAPVISVHPFRTDALAELERWTRQGVRFIKWLPNAQGIPVDDPALDEFYRTMIRHDMVLFVHAGKEIAASLWTDQELGNPLRLRYPLDLGVRVVVLHCASLGTYEDLDNPGKRANAFELFLRLMDEDAYDGRLFGEISAVTQINRIAEPLVSLIRRDDLHHRLINGSDYPLPAMNVVIQTWPLWWLGMITNQERGYLNEIYSYNPLLFDFVLKRSVKDPDTGRRLPAHVFLEHPDL